MVELTFQALMGLLVVGVAAVGAGGWIGRILPGGLRRFERGAFVVLGGFGALSTVLFLLGQVSFTPAIIWFVLGVSGAIGVVYLFRIGNGSSFRLPLMFAGTRRAAVPAALCILVLGFTAVCGLAEITGDWRNDAVAYHLLGPKVWLRDGVIRPVLDDYHTAFPHIAETMFAALWNVGGSRASNFSGFVMLGLLLAVAASIGIRLGLKDVGAWWVAALVATMPAVYEGVATCFIDVTYAAFVLAAVRLGMEAQRLREWAAVGLFCGFAVGTKYTGLLAVPVVMICLGLLHWNKNRSGQVAGGIGLAIATASVIGAPYFIRNWILLGCPIYPPPPSYGHFCQPKYMSAEAIAAFHAYIRHRGEGWGRGLAALLLLPFRLTYHTANFHGAGGIGLWPLALGPIGVVAARKKACAKVLALLALCFVLVWFVTQQESRFLIHAYVIGAVFSVLGWRAVAESGRGWARYLAVAVVLLSCCYGLFMIERGGAGEVRAVFSQQYAMVRRQGAVPYLASFDYLNGENSVRRVLILDRSAPPFYSNKDYVKPIGQWGERTLPGAPDSREALQRALGH